MRRRTRLATAFHELDLALFERLTGAHNPVLDRVMPTLSHAADHSKLWLATAAVMAASGRPDLRRAAGRSLVAVWMASLLTNGLVKLTFERRRPPIDGVPAARRVRRAPVTTSFPSGHSASAAAFAATVGRHVPALRAPVATVAAGVAFSRVWTGAHYPGDVLAGAGIGLAVAAVMARVRLRRRR